MPTPDWTRTGEWDVLTLGGKAMPGVARVEVDIGSGLDVQKSRGSRRACVKDTGTPPAEVSIELVLLPENMAAFEAVLPTINPRSATASKVGLSIGHPNAKLWGISMVKIGRISSPMPSNGGMFVVKIRAIEHIEAPKAIKKAVASENKGDWNVQPRIDALQSSPGNSSANEQNFSSTPPIEGSGF